MVSIQLKTLTSSTKGQMKRHISERTQGKRKRKKEKKRQNDQLGEANHYATFYIESITQVG